MSFPASDQLHHVLSHDLKDRLEVNESLRNCEDETDTQIPRNIFLESKYSTHSSVTEYFRTEMLNHMVQFHTVYSVSELTIYHAFHILESAMTKLTISRRDLEKYSFASLFLSLKFIDQFSGNIEDFCNLCSVNLTSPELLRLEREILIATNFKLHITTPIDVVMLIAKVTGELSVIAG